MTACPWCPPERVMSFESERTPTAEDLAEREAVRPVVREEMLALIQKSINDTYDRLAEIERLN